MEEICSIMSDSADDTATEETTTLSSPVTSKKIRKRKRKTEEPYGGDKLLKSYKREVARWDPTVPDDDIEEIVESLIPASLATIMKELDISQDNSLTKYIPREKVKKIITSIVINDINAPIRTMIYTYLLHFQRLKALVRRRENLIVTNDDDINPPKTLVEELKQLGPPGDSEPPFSEFVECLQGIVANVIKQVASVIEGNELLCGNSFANAVLSHISSHRHLKTTICTHLVNEICTFAGKEFYTFFREDTKFIRSLIKKYLSA